MVIDINGIKLGGNNPLCLIAGPCVMEEEAATVDIARKLKRLCQALNLPLIFKASYDKANRTALKSFRGPGLEKGLAILQRVKEEVAVPVLSDIHLPEEAEVAARVLDIIQIPAFLSRQTDLLRAAGRTGKVVNVKKGQFMAPEDTAYCVEKVAAGRLGGGPAGVLLTERGTFFGYHRLVVDFCGLQVMSRFAPVILDATHAVQQPSAGEVSGGRREFVPLLMRSAAAAGIAGLFLEVHPCPDRALSDGPNMLPVDALPELLTKVMAIDLLAKR